MFVGPGNRSGGHLTKTHVSCLAPFRRATGNGPDVAQRRSCRASQRSTSELAQREMDVLGAITSKPCGAPG